MHRAYKVLCGKVGKELTMQETRQAFTSLELIWDALFPEERYKLMHFLLEMRFSPKTGQLASV